MEDSLERPLKGITIALALDRHLDRFASQHQAMIWKDIARGDPDNWRFYFLEIMGEPSNLAYFNLREVLVDLGILRAATGRGSVTDWELLMIREHPEWWLQIRWMIDDRSVANPFEPKIGG